MKILGYPQLISYSSFRQPNFELMSHSLHWLIQRYYLFFLCIINFLLMLIFRADPNFSYPYEISNESDRVSLIKALCSQAQSKLHIKLNPKRLYGSELPCVHELVKIAKLICQASQINMSTAVSIPNDDKNAPEMKDSRLLASEITQNGAELADALGNERELRSLRAQALLVPMESDLAEAVLRQRLKEAKEQIKDLEQKKIERAQDKETLTDRITKKKEELERSKNRLQALRAMRFNNIIIIFLIYEMIYIFIIFYFSFF